MSVESLAIVLHHSTAKGTDKVVLLGIANHDGDGGAWPTVPTLARYANVTERNVQAAIRRLIEAGEVAVHVQAGGTANCPDWSRPNRYDVLVECPATCDRTKKHRHRPLPTAPAALWIEGVSPATPGVAYDTGGVSPTTPGGVSPATPKPSIEPSDNKGSRSVTGGGTTPPCVECSAPDLATCLRRQAKLAAKDRHSYRARSW